MSANLYILKIVNNEIGGEQKLLSDRKKKILQAVINENIKSAEPISSKDLQEKYFNSVSSATIRNELNGLEEMGYLSHPHTSSGRVPTTTGFKKYIAELMPEEQLTKAEVAELKSNFNTKINGIEELAVISAGAISKATNYASVVYMGLSQDAVIESIKLVKVVDEMCLAIIVTDMGVIKDITISLPKDATDDDVITAGRIISEAVSGKTIAELGQIDMAELISDNLDNYRLFFEELIDAIIERGEKKIVKYDGASNLLDQPEYKSIEKAKKAISIFENRKVLTPLLESGNDLEINISVGANEDNDCSVVSATYKINGKEIGKAGVVGPVRMDYAKAVSVLKEINNTIAENVNIGHNMGRLTSYGQQNGNQQKYVGYRNKNKIKKRGDVPKNGWSRKRNSWQKFEAKQRKSKSNIRKCKKGWWK